MKYPKYLLAFGLLLSLNSSIALATLIDRGNGMIYDTELNLTWLSDANYFKTQAASDPNLVNTIIANIGSVPDLYAGTHTLTASDFNASTGGMTWWGAKAWVKNLKYAGYSDWRLPQMINLPASGPYFFLSSEVGNLYSLELAGQGTTFNANIALFSNLAGNTLFWLNDEYAPTPWMAWSNGTINAPGNNYKNEMKNGWAVRVGDVTPTVSTPPVPPAINTTSLPAATVGVSYTANIATTVPAGDSATVTVTGLPSGLTYDAATSTITGAATVIGSFNVNVTVADSTTNLSASSILPLTVNDNALIFAPVNLPDATTNASYTTVFNAATGGYGSFTYTATGLPAGLAISGNTISGTPTAAGSYAITLTATDSVGTSTSANVTLNVINPVAAPVACSGSNAAITAYVARNPGYITVNGGLNLLDHLWTTNLNAGNTTFNGGMVNWYSTGAIVSWTGTVDTAGCILDHLTVSPRVTVNTSSLPAGVAGTAYPATPVDVAWGVAPYSTSVIGLPAGLSFDGVNITGTPTVAGTFTVSINTADSLGVLAASAPLTLTVSAPAISSFSANLPSGTVGTAYTGTLSASGGYGALSYSATGLPAGLTLTGNTISGTPTTAGTSTLSLTVTDSLGTSSSIGGTIVIAAAPVTPPSTTTDPSCTKPAGAKGGLNTKGLITSVNGNVVTITNKSGVSTTVTVPACAKVSWNGAKAFKVGQAFEWHGYNSPATGNVAQEVSIN